MAGDEKREGVWVFLSHSHLDLEKVRRIRNALEAEDLNPLMFFLKCLDDSSELDDLIRREIEARNWFILCDSPNSRKSRWVQEEVEIIKRLDGKVYEEIDLDDDLEAQVERVAALSKRATVFISHARTDVEIARALHGALREHEFRVFLDVDIRPGGSWADQIEGAIDQAVERGFFLLLLSPEALDSRWVREEVRIALAKRAAVGQRSNIVPILVGGDLSSLYLHEGLYDAIGRIHVFDLTRGDLRERIDELIRSLKTREMEQPKFPRDERTF